MRIGEIASRSGVGVETVRFYERRGLVDRPPRPHGGGYRSYPPETVRRIRFVREAQSLGFSLAEIGALLALKTDPGAACADVRERARAKLREVNARIERLAAIRSALETLIGDCRGTGPAARDCAILAALDSADEEDTP